MDSVTMSGLLKADEEKVRGELRADALIDQNRRQSVDRLNEEFGRLLLRYNAAAGNEPLRQSLADGMVSVARDMLELLTACAAKKEITRRKLRMGAIIALLIAVICGLIAAMLIRDYYLPGCICMALAALSAYFSGRLWYGEREVRVHAELDPETVWRTLKRTVDTMDRKSEALLSQIPAGQASDSPSVQVSGLPLDTDSLTLYGDLLEADCAGNGEYALRQLRKLAPWLRRQGVEAKAYSADTAELFELLPTKNASATLRPALVSDGHLLLAGRAAEHVD